MNVNRNLKATFQDYEHHPALAGLLEEIKKNKIQPVYSFQGEEEYFKDVALAKIKKQLFKDPTEEDFNFRTFYGSDLNCAEFFDELYTLPVQSGRKLLVIKDADKLNASSRETISEVLLDFPAFSHLVFFFRKIDKRTKFFQTIQKKAKGVDFYPLRDKNLKDWIINRFKDRNKDINTDALSFLLEETDGQLQNLEQEIEKICLYAGSRVQINLDDLIKTAAGNSQIYSVYDLVDKISQKDLIAGLKLFSKLIQDKKGLELVGILYWHYSRLWRAKFLMNKGTSKAQVSRELGIPPYYLSNFLNGLDDFSCAEIEGFFKRLLKTDVNLKSIQLPPRLMLELLIIDLCSA